jgi:DNA-binding FadR family transcriptional regulator
MDPIFRAAKQNRIFQDVVDQIQEAIIDGRLKVGEKLPAERELKEMLHTSRSTLREALRVLEQKGLIEIKLGMGGGAIVTAVSADQVTESLDLLIRSQKVSLNHLAEFRERVEGDVVALAAKRAGKTEIKKLTRLIDRAKNFVDQGSDFVEEFLEADRAVHFYFATITGNPIYISITKTIHGNIFRYFEKFLMPVMETPEMEENLQDLKDIAKAIAEHDAGKARRLAIKHVRRFNKYMKLVEQRKEEKT